MMQEETVHPETNESSDTSVKVSELMVDDTSLLDDTVQKDDVALDNHPVDNHQETKEVSQNNDVDVSQKEAESFAVFNGEPIKDLPKDLYIPPNALEVFLEAFEGPLDLLLYLIRRQNMDIVDIPIAEITEQYMEYVELMKNLNLELAAEYLVMAAVLCEIKSRVLLPVPKVDEEDEGDPRADLIRRLQEYERFKKAAEDIDELPKVGRDTFISSAEIPELDVTKPQPEVDLKEILLAFKDILRRAEMFSHHHIQREPLSVREKMTHVLAVISAESFTDFVTLFTVEEGRMGVVVTFLAVMELSKELMVEFIQADPFGPIHVRARIH